jgi:hypothetical protein
MERLNNDVITNIYKHLDIGNLILLSKQSVLLRDTVNEYLKNLKINYIDYYQLYISLEKYKNKYNMLKEAVNKQVVERFITDKCPNCFKRICVIDDRVNNSNYCHTCCHYYCDNCTTDLLCNKCSLLII